MYLLSGPERPDRWQWRRDAYVRINSAERVGMPTFRAVRMEQEVVEVPKSEVVVALSLSEPAVVTRAHFEKDLAVHQQSEKFDTRKIVLSTEPFD